MKTKPASSPSSRLDDYWNSLGLTDKALAIALLEAAKAADDSTPEPPPTPSSSTSHTASAQAKTKYHPSYTCTDDPTTWKAGMPVRITIRGDYFLHTGVLEYRKKGSPFWWIRLDKPLPKTPSDGLIRKKPSSFELRE